MATGAYRPGQKQKAKQRPLEKRRQRHSGHPRWPSGNERNCVPWKKCTSTAKQRLGNANGQGEDGRKWRERNKLRRKTEDDRAGLCLSRESWSAKARRLCLPAQRRMPCKDAPGQAWERRDPRPPVWRQGAPSQRRHYRRSQRPARTKPSSLQPQRETPTGKGQGQAERAGRTGKRRTILT